MRILLRSLAWLAGFLVLGLLGLLGFGEILFAPAMHGKTVETIALLGLESGLALFGLLWCFARLPGARRPPGAIQPFGLLQGLWGMFGFGAVMAASGALFANAAVLVNFWLIAHHAKARIDFTSHDFLLGAALTGEVAASLWILWYLHRLGPAHRRDGSAAGIAWCPAPPAGYAAATGCAVLLAGIVWLLFRLAPPDIAKLEKLPMSHLLAGHGLAVLPVLLLGAILAPLVEELVFRGIAFGGIAARLGPAWAGILTTLAFTLAHAQQKLHYWPGFIAVALFAAMAVALRLRFRSIRPGILLHILYNGSFLLAGALG